MEARSEALATLSGEGLMTSSPRPSTSRGRIAQCSLPALTMQPDRGAGLRSGALVLRDARAGAQLAAAVAAAALHAASEAKGLSSDL
eukprot:4820218-Heterocapsa_arctica.AAC.1